MRALRLLTDAASLARSGGSPRLELEAALLRYILTAEDPSLDALATRLAALEERAGAGSVPEPDPPVKARPANATAAADPVPVSIQKVRAAWQSVRGKAESEYQPLRGPLSGARVAEVDGDAIVVFARNAVDAAIVRERTGLLEAAVADVLGIPMRIVLRVEPASRAKGAAPGGVASVTADPGADDPDALFSYANERIQER